MARIPPATIETIRSRIDLARLIEESGVSLSRRGNRYVGRCPFHGDTDPSFNVSPDKGLFHCFGCGKSGTAFTYLSLREGLTFHEAVKKLAPRAGVSLKELEDTQPSDEVQRLAQANLEAQKLFRRWLKQSRQAMEYLERRGVTRDTIDELQIGYAPESWDALMNEMIGMKYDADFLVSAGLIRQNDKGRRYDYFRNRLIFPINDMDGNVAGFGGRALDDDAGPKYLNSPETPLYQKSQILYMLDRAHREVYQERRAVVAEGYMDVIALRQAGVLNAVAPLGAALSKYHARLLKRRCDAVTFILDGDEAGARAVERGAGVFLGEGLRVEAAVMPPGKDPDDIIQSDGAEAVKTLLNNVVPVVEFMIRHLSEKLDLSQPEAKLEAIDKAAELMRHVQSPILMRDYAARLAKELESPPKEVWAELRRRRVRLESAPDETVRSGALNADRRFAIERKLLGYMAAKPETILDVFDNIAPSDFQKEAHQELARILWEAAREGQENAYALIDACHDDETRELLSAVMIEAKPLPYIEAEIDAAVDRLVHDALKKMERERLAEMEQSGADALQIAKYLEEQSKQRRAMRQPTKTSTPHTAENDA